MMNLQIYTGDCREVLPKLATESVQCCVTSPPYWGLRDYGHADQIGQEPTPEAYVETMRQVFSEVRRVLTPDGTCWIVIGDSYARNGGTGACGPNAIVGNTKSGEQQRNCTVPFGLKPKDLCMIPARVALALQADGWWLRSDIIWAKPNSMPESVTDRPTRSHEYLFLLTKSERYHYDHEAIKEPCSEDMQERASKGHTRGANGKLDKSRQDTISFRGEDSKQIDVSNGRNKRSVWTIPSASYSEAHFATYPPNLIKPCILAGCPVGGLVLDPFGGSGTTGMVAIELGRRAALIELNPKYVKLMEQRCHTTPGLPLT